MNSPKSLIEIIDEYLANKDISPKARKNYRENLGVFINYLTRYADDPRKPKRSDVINYKEHLKNSGRSVSTMESYLVAVRGFFKYLEDSGIYDNIAAGIKMPKKFPEVRKSYLTADQVSVLMRSIDRSSRIGKRDYAIIFLMVNTGMRCIEVSRMNLLDATQTKTGYRIVIQGKGRINKDRSVHIPESVMFPIHNYLIERTDLDGKNNPPMFVNHARRSNNTRFTPLSISKIVKQYMRAVKIDDKKMTAHSLRHTAAINAIKAGANIVEVQSMLGHMNSSTTDVYLKALEAESMEEGTAIRLLNDYYGNATKQGKNKKIPV